MSMRWHVLNRCISIQYSNIEKDNCCTNSGLRQFIPDVYSPKQLALCNLLPEMGLTSGKLDCWQFRTLPDPPIHCWDWTHHLELSWYEALYKPGWEREFCPQLKWPEQVQEGMIWLLAQVQSLAGKNRHLRAEEKNPTISKIFQISTDASSKPSLRVHSVNGFYWQFYHRSGGIASFCQHERDILIKRPSQ